MASIAEHLATLNLSQYAGRFAAEGVASVTQLLALSNEDLDTRLSSLGMLKGHAMKFRISLEALKQGRPPVTQPQVSQSPVTQKSQPPKPPAAKVQTPDNPLMVETQRINAKLAEIDSLRQAISTSKDAIMRLDVEAYRKVLEQIETLQASLRTQETQAMEVQEGQE